MPPACFGVGLRSCLRRVPALSFPIATIAPCGFVNSFSRNSHKGQPRNHPSAQEMLFYYLVNVCGQHLRIPNTIRINHHSRTDGAETHRSALG